MPQSGPCVALLILSQASSIRAGISKGAEHRSSSTERIAGKERIPLDCATKWSIKSCRRESIERRFAGSSTSNGLGCCVAKPRHPAEIVAVHEHILHVDLTMSSKFKNRG